LLTLTPVLGAAWLAPYDPNALFTGPRLESPSRAHPLGTDLLGRDQLSRTLYGGRIALGVAAAVLSVSVGAGALVGAVAGYYGGWVDEAASAVLTMLLALPDLILTIALVAVLGPSLWNMALALTLLGWVSYARLFRGAVLAARAQPFIEAARAAGAGDARIVARHILPNVARPFLAFAGLRFAGVILSVATLSFLGLGVQPPTADWGTMLSDARPYFRSAPYLALPPALCVVLVSLGANLLADALLTAPDRRQL